MFFKKITVEAGGIEEIKEDIKRDVKQAWREDVYDGKNKETPIIFVDGNSAVIRFFNQRVDKCYPAEYAEFAFQCLEGINMQLECEIAFAEVHACCTVCEDEDYEDDWCGW